MLYDKGLILEGLLSSICVMLQNLFVPQNHLNGMRRHPYACQKCRLVSYYYAITWLTYLAMLVSCVIP